MHILEKIDYFYNTLFNFVVLNKTYKNTKYMQLIKVNYK